MRGRLALLLVPVAAAVIVAVYLARSGDAVFFVSLDTVRADHLGCYGYASARTPFLDGLAKSGTVFDHAISSASFTPASHASMFTGLYPWRHGVRFLWGFDELRLKPGVSTLAEVLGANGFATGAFISSRPLQKQMYGLDRGFDIYDESFLVETPRPERPRVSQLSNQRRADETLAACLRWLETPKPATFFAFVHLFDAHDSQVDPPPEFKRAYLARMKAGEDFNSYDFEIAWMDAQLASFFDKVRPLIGRRRLLIIAVGDHGQGLGDHGYPRHGERLYQEEIRVPFIWSGDGIEKGRRVDTYVRTVDILPTIAEIYGFTPPAGMDGRSLVGVMRGEDTTDRISYSETLHPLSKDREALFAVIKGRRKIIYAPQSGRIEYYDLAADPSELHDLAAAGGYDDLLAELKKHNLSTDFERSRGSDPEIEEGLRALGYVN